MFQLLPRISRACLAHRRVALVCLASILVLCSLGVLRLEGQSDASSQRTRLLGEAVRVGVDHLRNARFTSPDMLALEADLWSQADSLSSNSLHALAPADVQALLEARFPWAAPEQMRAVFAATTGSNLGLVIGRPGTGKTHPVSSAIAAAYMGAGYQVLGLALSGKAAQGLHDAASIQAVTFAQLRRYLESGEHLPTGSVLIVDEAGMLNTRQVATLLRQANERDLKVVMLGDPDQLPPIGAGDPFRGLVARYPSADLIDIRRQQHPWMRRATRDLVRGDIASALGAYSRHHYVHERETPLAARNELVSRYLDEPDTERTLVLAATNAEVDRLNRTIRSSLMAAGHLTDDPSAPFVAGDRVLLTRNSLDGGYRNGTLGTVLRAGSKTLELRLDTGDRVTAPADDGTVVHGYALTVHRAQGVSADRVLYLAGYADRHLALVAMTRHRDTLEVFWDRETFETYSDLLRTLRRPSANDLVGDYSEPPKVSLPAEALVDPLIPPIDAGALPKLSLDAHRAANRGLAPEPLPPAPEHVPALLRDYGNLRGKLFSLPAGATDPRSRWERFDYTRRLHQVADDLAHAAGRERLPITMPLTSLEAYVEAERAIREAPSYTARVHALEAQSRLANAPPSQPGDPQEARERLVELVATTWSLEQPAARAAAAVYLSETDPSDPLARLLERFNSDPSETSALAVVKELGATLFSPEAISRWAVDPVCPGSDKVAAGYELKLALRSAHRSREVLTGQLDELLAAHDGGLTAKDTRQDLDRIDGTIRDLRTSYGEVRYAEALHETELLEEALAHEPEAADLHQALDRTTRAAASIRPYPLLPETAHEPYASYLSLDAERLHLEAAVEARPADAANRIRLHQLRRALADVQYLADFPADPPLEVEEPAAALAEHLEALDHRASILARYFPVADDRDLLDHLAAGELSFIEDLYGRVGLSPPTTGLSAPLSPRAAVEHYNAQSAAFRALAGKPGLRVDDPELLSLAASVRLAQGQAVDACLEPQLAVRMDSPADLVRAGRRIRSAALEASEPDVQTVLPLHRHHRRGGLHRRLASMERRRALREVLRFLTGVSPTTSWTSLAVRAANRLLT